jgi:hypothetical protein
MRSQGQGAGSLSNQMSWTLVETDAYVAALNYLGGYNALDIALEPIYEGLRRFPYGFNLEDLGEFSFRYAKTIKIGGIAPLIVVFSIEQGKTVLLKHI